MQQTLLITVTFIENSDSFLLISPTWKFISEKSKPFPCQAGEPLNVLLAGLTRCMNDQDCLGVNRVCSHEAGQLDGECVCQEGFVQEAEDSFACAKKADPLIRHLHTSCNSDEDCKRNEMCMSWKYDPSLELARSAGCLREYTQNMKMKYKTTSHV